MGNASLCPYLEDLNQTETLDMTTSFKLLLTSVALVCTALTGCYDSKTDQAISGKLDSLQAWPENDMVKVISCRKPDSESQKCRVEFDESLNLDNLTVTLTSKEAIFPAGLYFDQVCKQNHLTYVYGRPKIYCYRTLETSLDVTQMSLDAAIEQFTRTVGQVKNATKSQLGPKHAQAEEMYRNKLSYQ